jgi:putative membrane protein
MRFLLRMLVGAFALVGVAAVSEGSLLIVEGETLGEQFVPAIFAALIIGIANATVGAIAKAVLKIVTLPIGCLTLGLSNLAIGILINTGMFYLAAGIVSGFEVMDFWSTALAAVIIAVVMAIANGVIDKDD